MEQYLCEYTVCVSFTVHKFLCFPPKLKSGLYKIKSNPFLAVLRSSSRAPGLLCQKTWMPSNSTDHIITTLKIQKYIQIQVQLKFSYKYIKLLDKVVTIMNHDHLFDFCSLRNSFARAVHHGLGHKDTERCQCNNCANWSNETTRGCVCCPGLDEVDNKLQGFITSNSSDV